MIKIIFNENIILNKQFFKTLSLNMIFLLKRNLDDKFWISQLLFLLIQTHNVAYPSLSMLRFRSRSLFVLSSKIFVLHQFLNYWQLILETNLSVLQSILSFEIQFKYLFNCECVVFRIRSIRQVVIINWSHVHS